MTPVLNLLYSSTALSVSGKTDMIAVEGVSVLTRTPVSLVGSCMTELEDPDIEALFLYGSWSGPSDSQGVSPTSL